MVATNHICGFFHGSWIGQPNTVSLVHVTGGSSSWGDDGRLKSDARTRRKSRWMFADRSWFGSPLRRSSNPNSHPFSGSRCSFWNRRRLAGWCLQMFLMFSLLALTNLFRFVESLKPLQESLFRAFARYMMGQCAP